MYVAIISYLVLIPPSGKLDESDDLVVFGVVHLLLVDVAGRVDKVARHAVLSSDHLLPRINHHLLFPVLVRIHG